MERKYAEFAATKACELLAIDSPSGYTRKAADWVKEAFSSLGFDAQLTTKGGVLVNLGGADEKDALLLEAHTDTLGAMVAEVKANGRLRLTPLGGMRAENAETRAELAESRAGELEQELADTTAQLEDVSASYENLAASEESWKEMADAYASELEGENAKSEAFDALVDFANGHNPGGSSDIFRISEAVVVMKTSDAPRSVLLTTDFNPNSIVRRELDGDAADVAFTEDKWGSSTPMTITPKHAGTTIATFSNTNNKQTFTMLVIVFDG